MNSTNGTSTSKLAPIPVRSRAGMRARARAHKKMQNKNCLGRCYTWVSSSCSSTISKVSNYFPSLTLNKVASAIVVASYIGGIAYAVNNQTPWWKGTSPQYDIPGGAAIAIGTSVATCCVTAAIQQMRGNELDALTWKCAAVASVLSGLPFISQITQSQISTIKSEVRRYDVDYPKWAGDCQPTGLGMLNSRSNSLECPLLDGAKPYIDQRIVEKLTGSTAGAMGVYFPQDVPVVIKRDHHRENVLKIEDAKKICQENNYLHLTVPKASYYKEYSIHTLLPIPHYHELAQLELYMENKNLFNDAVKEFTGLLCQAHMSDLIGRHVGVSNWPRLDNAMTYLEKDGKKTIGKIALVDLDDFKRASYMVDLSGQMDIAVRFFPYHLEEIIQAAKKFYPTIENQRSKLEYVQQEAIKTYEIVYGIHSAHVKAKGISFSNPGEFLPVTDKTKIQVKKGVIAELLKYKDGNSQYTYSFSKLNENREESLSIIEKVLPEIIDQSIAFISGQLNEKVQSNKKGINSHARLLALRKLTFNGNPKLEKNSELLYELPQEIRVSIADYLAITIFKKLAEVGGIAQVIDSYQLVLYC